MWGGAIQETEGQEGAMGQQAALKRHPHRPDFSAGMKKKHPRPHGLREVCSQAHLGTLGYTSCPFNC